MDTRTSPLPQCSAETIEDWMVSWLAREVPMPAEEIDVTQSFDTYGVSSLLIVTMTGALEEWLGCEVDPAVAYDYSSIETLAAYLASQIGPHHAER